MRIIDYTNASVEDIYGSLSFNDKTMREWLPKSIYKEVKAVQFGEQELTLEVAEVVASAMKDWATQKGATHYTHWFQPLTGLTAEKHDSFISPVGDGTVIMEFSGKELIQGEPDASSFPSGGLRATFEARGYTAWDTTSPAFLKEQGGDLTLCIPTAFVSYTTEALDKKVPVLRSGEALSKQAMRILKVMGNTTTKRIVTTAGPEQEYFLIDKDYYDERPDLQLTGRTVFGKLPAKGQELDDHYFGAIKEKVAGFMKELNFELWKLGISAKTQHNEVAPHQYEIAPIYAATSVAVDSNQLVMETMKKVATRHGLAALLHEKPFAGVNGSGKHNNWSIGTDDGQNLLEPGDDPRSNARFLLFLAATIKAVDTYAPILRASASNAGNDHRLGANEAPPAIISIFLGDQLTEIVEAIAAGKPVPGRSGEKMEIGVTTLPKLPMDMTDRNRTSPFAFTGNKFEFRMVASSQSIAGPNVVLNTTVAEVLSVFADRLEKASDVNAEIQAICKETFNECKKVIFNGNGYSEEWVAEAEKRGLPNITATVYALPEYIKPDSVAIFEKHKVLSKKELESRVSVYMEKYSMQINIEASMMVEIANKMIFPAGNEYAADLAAGINGLKSAGAKTVPTAQLEVLEDVVNALNCLKDESDKLKDVLEAVNAIEDETEQAVAFKERVFTQMAVLRECGDDLEPIIGRDYWPLPTYEDMLFRMG
ncbi:MAG: glutamine synthetase III [Spirochaetaceae bacterium]|nr:glutamine synthetase III [Spirochaetaceae bacterium]MDT8298229.1 glutamine synthetase III [Spirochaetaceae bacterium]